MPRITLFICLEKHFRGGDDTSDSDSDIVITSRSTAEFNQADTVVFEFEPRNKSTPKHKPENEGEEMNVTLPAIIAKLSQPIDHGRTISSIVKKARLLCLWRMF
ncbi:hypothetical protein CgunFtcFv8_007490 [Champsocephalus gunnari]|uniref:Uncharacterized protein n=1 Tax=Champsocephalus gunnari TaxID=52237 RepID=A0AAN8CGJ5_CHAGU|nr:hypothetical protein CgunFtcFv8_007490 [Champsocephalus gunnari]